MAGIIPLATERGAAMQVILQIGDGHFVRAKSLLLLLRQRLLRESRHNVDCLGFPVRDSLIRPQRVRLQKQGNSSLIRAVFIPLLLCPYEAATRSSVTGKTSCVSPWETQIFRMFFPLVLLFCLYEGKQKISSVP